MKRKLISIGAIVLALALPLALAPACGNGEEGEIKTLKIGFMGALSGPVAPWGTDHERGVKWAAEDINRAGGIKVGKDTYKVEVISCDCKETASVTAECATRFVFDEGIRYVIGPIITTQAAVPILNEHKVFQIELGATFYGGPDKPYYINGSTVYEKWTAAFYQQGVQHYPEVKTVAIIGPNDDTGHSNVAASVSGMTTAGLTAVSQEYYAAGTVDFYPILTKVLRSNPDVIDTGPSGPGDQALMVKSAREMGFTGPIWEPSYVPLDLLIETVGLNDLYDISTGIPDFSSEFYSPEMRTLNQRFLAEKAKPGETVIPDVVVHGYSHMMFYKQAIETAGSIDPDEVVKVLDDPNFTFERYYVENAKLGGIESFGIRRQMPHFNPYCQIVVEGGEAKVVQMGGVIISAP